MRRLQLLLIEVFLWPLLLSAQSDSATHYQLYGGFSYLSNSFNGVPGARQGLSGWDAGLVFPAWHGLGPI